MKIPAAFADNQAALPASRSVYKAAEVIYSGRLDEQIYHPVSA
jgi:hypothetical protein